MNYPKRMREIRGDYTIYKWTELTGIHGQTQKAWEGGEHEPSETSINQIADALGWDDETRMSHMPKPKGHGLSARLERRKQYLRLSQSELAEIFDKGTSTVASWMAYPVPKLARELVLSFLELEDDEVFAFLHAKSKDNPKLADRPYRSRTPIPYELIYQLEGDLQSHEYTPINTVDDDNPILKQIQEAMK